MEKFDKELLMVKARSFNPDWPELPGHLVNGICSVTPTGQLKVFEEAWQKEYTVDSATICVNTRIKDSSRKYVYDHDLLKCWTFADGDFFAYVEWSDYEKSWVLRRSFEYGGCTRPDKATFKAVGNVRLNASDADLIRKQDEKERAREVVIDNSYCPSRFKK